MIEIDGAAGEGGGQIVRSALSLSLLTGRPFTIHQIRGKRQKPGLLRQHLTAVKAAARIGAAEVEGAHLGSDRLVFPHPCEDEAWRSWQCVSDMVIAMPKITMRNDKK